MLEQKYIDLTKKVITDTEELLANNKDSTGNIIMDKSTLKSMSQTIQEGLLVYNYVIEKELYKDDVNIQNLLPQINTLADKVMISEKNAKDLNIRDGMINWTKLQGLLVTLCLFVLNKEEISL